MTEEEWHSATDLRPMLGFLKGRASDRKLRLFVCAWCRHIWYLMSEPASRKAVEVAELYADGLADEPTRLRASDEAFVTRMMIEEEDDAVHRLTCRSAAALAAENVVMVSAELFPLAIPS